MLRTGREEAANMVPELGWRKVVIHGYARHSVKEVPQGTKQGGTASIFVALECLFEGGFYFLSGENEIVLNAEC
jgi:hypothetical protein